MAVAPFRLSELGTMHPRLAWDHVGCAAAVILLDSPQSSPFRVAESCLAGRSSQTDFQQAWRYPIARQIFEE